MRILANEGVRRLFLALSGLWLAFLLLAEGSVWLLCQRLSLGLPLLALLALGAVWAVLYRYFRRQDAAMEQAVSQIDAYLAGDTAARIDCDREGELYRLFHAVNSLAAVLNAHADKEQREKEFLKNMISDISHQLKTPLAALNIYNGLLQSEAEGSPNAQELAALSERELDRMEALIRNLLAITRLDAGAVVLERERENVAELMRDVELRFAARARHERKELVLDGPEELFLLCDRDWMLEAVGNLVKNALDHTEAGGTVRLEWRALPSSVQIAVKDNGSGIHPEDLYHIFKRFYRSRFSKDRQGIGLGLPLAKAIAEAHGGVIEADSQWGMGSVFTMTFPIPTKS